MPETNESTALTTVAPADTSLQPATLGQLQAFAETFAVSSLLPAHLRNRPADVAITVLYGRELGLTPMQAIQGIFVIEGKPGVSAATAVALVKRSPICEYFQCVETTDQRATYETKRRGEAKPSKLTFTIEDAKRAELLSKGTWKKYPAAMLRNRAAIQLARDVYPDVVANILSEDETDDLRAPSMVAPPAPVGPAPTPTAVRPPAGAIEVTVNVGAPAASLLERVAAAPTFDALVALAADCKAAPPAEHATLRAAYAKRKKELDAADMAAIGTPASPTYEADVALASAHLKPPLQESKTWGDIVEAGTTTVEREPGADDDA